MGRVLIVEDVHVQALHLQRLLERDGHSVGVCRDATSALREANKDWDMVLADLQLDDLDGLELYQAIRETLGDEAPHFVIQTAYGTVENARAALKMGVYDYITKPVDPTELRVLVKNVLEYRRLKRENRELSQAVAARKIEERIIGRSRAILRTIELAKAAAGSEATVLVRGESGTGKELIAELVHAASPRAGGPLVKVNCGAIPENLLEAELFGHEAGAFTDAKESRVGRFELASGGTIFLDEIAEMSPALQVKLLRVLQERELERLGGGGQVIPLDLRLVAATNRDLESLIVSGALREDLYYRINVITIHVPPLRERRGDIELLANHFCAHFNEKNRKHFKGLSPPALELLRRYHWPGNVRELENVIERAVVLGRGEWITPEHLPANIRSSAPPPGRDGFDVVARVLDAGLTLNEFERRMIARALERCDGNISRAARLLGLTRRTLQYRMRRDGIRARG
ncbi:MAG: sigma-54-dependent Fis family transcriptional regulator [Planctomycetota bacterium]|nr:MAG: sigma-54-dependent Fis family transcriptional regulator [Planctomycetota bacterium]